MCLLASGEACSAGGLGGVGSLYAQRHTLSIVKLRLGIFCCKKNLPGIGRSGAWGGGHRKAPRWRGGNGEG